MKKLISIVQYFNEWFYGPKCLSKEELKIREEWATKQPLHYKERKILFGEDFDFDKICDNNIQTIIGWVIAITVFGCALAMILLAYA